MTNDDIRKALNKLGGNLGADAHEDFERIYNSGLCAMRDAVYHWLTAPGGLVDELNKLGGDQMSAQHTPGPWHVDVHKNVMSAGGLVAFPGIAAGFDQEANARLIAAAPELLEVLQGLHDDIMDYMRLNKLGGENNHWLVQARVAIAKATGSTS